MNALSKKTIAFALVASTAVGGSAMALMPYGPRFDARNVDAYSTVFYTEYFVGGEVARVTLRGDGDTDLDLFVYDENGVLIVSGTGYTDYESVAWIPNWTGRFRIEVKNLGSVYNQYRIDME